MEADPQLAKAAEVAAAVVVVEDEFMMEIEKNTRTVVEDIGHILLYYVMVAFLLNGAFGISLLFNEFFGMWSAIELQDWLEPPLIYVLLGVNALCLLVTVLVYYSSDAFKEQLDFFFHFVSAFAGFLFFGTFGGVMLYFYQELEPGADLIMGGIGFLTLIGALWKGYGACIILMAGTEGFRELDWVKNNGRGNSDGGGGCGGCGGGGCGGGG